MNTFRKIKKNSKALSPVVASIILIAVTVAVSVVVAAWMGGMTIGLMGNAEQAQVTNAVFTSDQTVNVTVRNTGSDTVSFSVNCATIDGHAADNVATEVAKGSSETIEVTYAGAFTAGAQYELKLITDKGTSIVYTATYSSSAATPTPTPTATP
jgi:flagellin-like protein